MNKDKLKGTLLVIISALTFGNIPLFSKFAYNEGLSVSTLLFLRFFTASIILWLYILIKKFKFKTTKANFRHILLISIIGYAGSSSGLFYAYKYISSSLATIVIYCYPIIVVGYEMICNRKNGPDYKKLFCLTTTTIGLVLVVCIGPMKINLTGVILAFLGAIAYAYFCVGIGDKRIESLNSIVVSTYVMSSCMMFYFLQCVFTNEPLLPSNMKGFLYSLILAIVCSIIPTVTMYEGVKRIGVGNSVIIGTFEPLFVCILGVVFLHEIITTNMVIGGSLIILSLIFLQVPSEKIYYKKMTYK
ncbi:DMT family transporter [Tepidibacter hydrothermalis]|uniref:DMT family transporter n=1 Tax=Tepidibacter hydrothermalis TaxID=3036126 RepID=A0ABY8ECT6_9FIRM|nr:DMT family transporter [Tepidibacter hydrothermalis]WFD10727.1 DMT family transporter [Tepidibacter hydrothermalis]